METKRGRLEGDAQKKGCHIFTTFCDKKEQQATISDTLHSAGQKRHLDVAGQSPRDNFCLSVAGVILKEEKTPSFVGERQFGRHFRRQFGRGSLRVKNCLETLGDKFCRETSDVSQGPLFRRHNQQVLNVGA